MLVLRCTRKLLSAVGETGPTGPPRHDPLDSWHANLFHWERRKCVMVINDRTLLPVLLFGVKKEQLANLSEAFAERFCSLLEGRRVPDYVVDKVRQLYSAAHITKTKNRSVAGSLNQFTKEVKWVVAEGYRRDPLVDIRDVDDFLWGQASVQIPEFYPARALTDVFLSRFVENGRQDLAEARVILRMRSRLD